MSRPLQGKRIILGVTGSIAAYKAADLLRRLQARGAEVQVVMTPAAQEFIAPATFRTLSGKPVLSDLFAEPVNWRVEHVSLADWAELIIIAPATTNTIARLASGLCDDLLGCLALSTRAPILLAPAMDEGMLLHPITQANLQRLQELGYLVVEGEAGALASGKVGKGRLAPLEMILKEAEKALSPQDLAKIRLVLTAGPTREPIDAVRFITNRSSGKMGYALAEAARRRGAEVALISGPTNLPAPAGVELIAVQTVAQMYEAALEKAAKAKVFIGAAAVGDFTPQQTLRGKLKQKADLTLKLKPTADIISAVAALGRKRPKVVVGFAAESEKLAANAKEKLARKKLDLIVANDISRHDSGFESDYNQAMLFFAEGREHALERMAKSELAEKILDAVKKLLAKK